MLAVKEEIRLLVLQIGFLLDNIRILLLKNPILVVNLRERKISVDIEGAEALKDWEIEVRA